MEQVFRCAVPVLYESPVNGYPYARGATCFLVVYRGHLIAVTARHGIQNNSNDPQSIRVLAAPGVQAFLPLDGLMVSHLEETHADIAMIHVDHNALDDEQRRLIHPLDLDIMNRTNTFSVEHSVLCLRGYPDVFYPFDYANRKMSFTGYYTECRYVGTSQPHCHEMEFLSPLDFETASGLSGSPVIHAVRTRPNELGIDFAGMIVMAGKTRGHFIDSSAIYTALDVLASKQRLQAPPVPGRHPRSGAVTLGGTAQ